MKKSLLWALVLVMSISLVAFFNLSGCRRVEEQVVEEATGELEEEALDESEVEEESAIKIISAERTHMITEFYGITTQQYTPLNPDEDVILVLEIGGILTEEFIKIESNKLYLKVEEQLIGFDYSWAGILGGEEKILLITAVPQQVLEFKLFIGDYSPITFKVDEEIQDELKL
jgi:hypothetical protein